MIVGVNPKAGYEAHKTEIDEAMTRVMDSGRYLNGFELNSFEQEFAKYIGVKYAVGVGSGTEAIYAALIALGIRSGDEVITVSFTCTPTIAAIEQAGATVVMVDIDPEYYTIDPVKIEAAITNKTKAILPVHLYGHPAQMDLINVIADKYNLVIVEDACQAHGAEYKGKKAGSIGLAGCFSFYPTKNLGSFGDGGIVVTDDANVAKRVRLFREYGWEKQHDSIMRGWNSRLDELQAAVLRVKLKYLDCDNKTRTRIAAIYSKELIGYSLDLPKQREGVKHAWHQYVVRTSRREELMSHFQDKGIKTAVHYPTPVHLQPVYKNNLKVSGDLKHTEKAANEVLSLPIHAHMNEDQVGQVIVVAKTLVKELARAR